MPDCGWRKVGCSLGLQRGTSYPQPLKHLSTDLGWVYPSASNGDDVGRVSDVRLSRELFAQGYSYAELLRLKRTGQLTRIRRGAYANREEPDPHLEHRRLLVATLGQTTAESVVSHHSAAVLHGLPVRLPQPPRVHLTRARPNGGKIRTYVHLHVAALSELEVCDIDAFRVTSLARTVVDLALVLDHAEAVAVGDAALSRGLLPEELDVVLRLSRRRRGRSAAHRAVSFLDGRSESVGESRSRIALAAAGLPKPELQYEVRDPSGGLVGRADFCWEAHRTLGEFDGRIKYGRLLRPGQDASDVVFEEKRREDALRDLGWQVVRWTWDDLGSPSRLAERIRRAFARGKHVA